MQMKAFPDSRFGQFDVRDEYFDDAELLKHIFADMIVLKAEHSPIHGGFIYHAHHPAFKPVAQRSMLPTYGAVVKTTQVSYADNPPKTIIKSVEWVKEQFGNWQWIRE